MECEWCRRIGTFGVSAAMGGVRGFCVYHHGLVSSSLPCAVVNTNPSRFYLNRSKDFANISIYVNISIYKNIRILYQ